MTGHDLLTLAETAFLLRMSVRSLRRLLRAGRLPRLRPAGRVLVRRADVEAFLASSVCGVERRTRSPDPRQLSHPALTGADSGVIGTGSQEHLSVATSVGDSSKPSTERVGVSRSEGVENVAEHRKEIEQ
jgi:excisionase family DNA binding protein